MGEWEKSHEAAKNYFGSDGRLNPVRLGRAPVWLTASETYFCVGHPSRRNCPSSLASAESCDRRVRHTRLSRHRGTFRRKMKAIELSHITTRYQQPTVDGFKIFYRE